MILPPNRGALGNCLETSFLGTSKAKSGSHDPLRPGHYEYFENILKIFEIFEIFKIIGGPWEIAWRPAFWVLQKPKVVLMIH